MRRRMGRPGLIGTMARTAVIAGTATAVSGNIQQKQQAGAARAQAAADEQASQAAQVSQSQAEMAVMQSQLAALQQAAPAAAPQDAPGGDLMATLERLGSMKSAGLLTDAEFSAAKARLLGL